MIKAVITGDIINSRSYNSVEKKFITDSLKETLNDWGKIYNAKSELFRGDSFQCVVSDVKNSLRFMLLIKAFIKSINFPIDFDSNNLNSNINVDARISMGIGEVDLELESITISDGIAFNLSGTGLDKIKDSKQSLIILTDDIYQDELETEAVLIDAIVGRATSLQSEVIMFKLLGLTEVKIAEKIDKKQSAVNQRANAGDWFAIDAFIKRFENIYGNN